MKIRIADNKRLISPERAIRTAARRAGHAGRGTGQAELCYKRLYFFKIQALAARTPFPPKKINYILFYDAFMNQAGLTEGIPSSMEKEIDGGLILPDAHTLKTFEAQREDFVEKYILHAYLLKRPELRDQGYEEVYLPYWACRFSPDVRILVNAATGRVNI